MRFWNLCSVFSYISLCPSSLLHSFAYKAYKNDILEILANLGDQRAALGVSWDGCEHPSFSFALAFDGQEKQKEDLD